MEKERKEFIKTVSHEFRNPLTIIFGQSQVLKSRFYSSPEKIKEIAEQIEISSKRISDLVDRLLKVGEEDGKDTGS
ncbi:MAG: histidine kinase dimerization/phospho-acceptor domain-containing protein [Dictyoglomus sp.]|uniref:histidine kinase dimerization/phospho-acceptor domain-containing protein n=1 Tax=Dictyoglomus TaxID=13 RepID=UPI003C795E5D